jgi:hypothetical protein
MSMAGTLSGARSLIAKAEIEVGTRKLSWAVLSMAVISDYIRYASDCVLTGKSPISKAETEVETPRL